MAAPIPAAARLSAPPPWALGRVPGLTRGERPLALARLDGGSVNEVFRVDSRCGSFVLRLNGPAWRRPGVDRDRELLLHGAAAAAGIAPGIVHAEPDREGLLITDYHAGRLWREQDYADVPALHRLGARLQQLHALPAPDIAQFDPWPVAGAYLRQIEAAPPAWLLPQQLAAPLARLERSCAALGLSSSPSCIVHGDLAQNNLLEGSRLWLLDWEYAQRSHPLMDVACVLAYYPSAQRHGAELASAAGLGAVGPRDEELAERVYVYRALAWLWHLARAERATAP
jgi:aminoglycoside phosphotransferase (APT) family kinase protein